MGRNRASDDMDYVLIDDKATKESKESPPAPWSLPEFDPIEINNPIINIRRELCL